MRVALPAPRLAPLVRRYIGYRADVAVPGVHRGLPSPGATFIVALDDGVDVIAQTDPRQSPDRYNALVGGMHRRPALVAYGVHQEGVQIDLTPLGVRALLGIPLAALWDLTAHLEQVVSSWSGELQDRLRAAPGWDERFAVCDAVLVRRARAAAIHPALGHVWDSLTVSASPPAVEELAGRVGWSRQHLRRRFASEFGTGPKLVARLARFDRARRAFQPGELAADATRFGYADQAHMTRDFVAFAGCTPGQLAGDVLATGAGGAATVG